MDEFDLFAVKRTNQIRPFIFWENLKLANLLFEINWPLVWQKIPQMPQTISAQKIDVSVVILFFEDGVKTKITPEI